MLIIHALKYRKKIFFLFFQGKCTAVDSSKLVFSERPIGVHYYDTVWPRTKNQEFLFSTWRLLKKCVGVFKNMLFY